MIDKDILDGLSELDEADLRESNYWWTISLKLNLIKKFLIGLNQ